MLATAGAAQCDLPRVSTPNIGVSVFNEKRSSTGVIWAGLFGEEELTQWYPQAVLEKHGRERIRADDTRGAFSTPVLAEYIERQDPAQTIFLSSSQVGVFGEAVRFAVEGRRM